MGLENGKWRVKRGDCLSKISKSVYGTTRRWPDIANANGIRQSNPIIYPGQLLKLPGKSSSSSPAPSSVTGKSVKITWFALDAGTERDMFVTWDYSRSHTKDYEVKWEYDTGQGGWRSNGVSNETERQTSYSAPENAKRVRVSITPKAMDNSKDKPYWTDGKKVTREYNFSNNPPGLPPSPEFSIDTKDVATVKFNNISDKINADKIEIAIYQDDNYKYKTGTVNINTATNFAKYITDVEPGHFYRVRCRALRGTNIYGGWTEFTDNDVSTPIAPKEILELRSEVISEQMSKKYAVRIKWTEVPSAKHYLIEWTTNEELFGTDQVSNKETTDLEGNSTLISDLELGHRYYFRVASVNDKGKSRNYTEVESVELGVKPAAPTTYSNVSSATIGDKINLYWIHNSLDGSIETTARLHIEVEDSTTHLITPVDKVIPNNRPDEDKNKTNLYIIDTSLPEWKIIKSGSILRWKVQTTGIVSTYSEWSVEREINVYAKPTLAVNIQNGDGMSVDEISSFPFYIFINASPSAQIPLSYYIEVIANDTYETVSDDGIVKRINKGTSVYTKYYDPDTSPWQFVLEMNPGDIDLESNISYTLNVTVSMDSGLSATSSTIFSVFLNDLYYDVFADVDINKKILEASIHPYCYEYETVGDQVVPKLLANCSLAVYRKNYDGTFTLIQKDIPNDKSAYITDPHPSLDYARYRIVSKTNDTGAISYADVNPVPILEPAIVIQWNEKWEPFKVDNKDDGLIEPDWPGSMIKLPYNVSISESNKVSVTMVEYAGRQRPVSYYGTHLGETQSFNTDIPREDKETIYALRKLARYTDNVYVREPSGPGYWAHVEVSISQKRQDVTIPVSISVTRVEGGI